MEEGLSWNPGEDLDSFIPETHIRHLLCVSHQARLNSGNCNLEGVFFISEPKIIPCCHVCLLSTRLTLLLTDGTVFFLKNESPLGDCCQLPVEPQHRPLWGPGPGISDAFRGAAPGGPTYKEKRGDICLLGSTPFSSV